MPNLIPTPTLVWSSDSGEQQPAQHPVKNTDSRTHYETNIQKRYLILYERGQKQMENAITTTLAIIINDAVAPVGAAGITGSKVKTNEEG